MSRDTTITEAERERRAQEIRAEQEAMGGLERYQKASMYGAKSSKFVCADWVVPLLKQQLSETPSDKNDHRLRILDVGAIDNQYLGHDDWLDAVPIDLHGGQHESVLQADFFDYAHDYCSGIDRSAAKESSSSSSSGTKQSPPPRPFDAIVMSLVLNFQGDPRKRGDMLALAADPRLLTPDETGMLFVALPAASLDNSRYCDLQRFVEVATNPLFRFELVEQKVSAKLVLLAFRRKQAAVRETPPPTPTTTTKRCCYDAASKRFDYGDHEMKRLPAKPGTKRNNFAVILKSSRNRTT
jgi:25S rRNA (adenine2142-N1)-methyltransferase